MKTTTLKNKKLETFLKEQGCYKKFMKNLNSDEYYGIGDKINFKKYSEANLIQCAFMWLDNTYFWHELSNKWHIYIYKNKTNLL
ncbi:MAG: hypothetical protein M0R17_06380 [Candidatus Omnitrophica bacterium]|jgi:hypothetical protein|nr:hypothetical protein [Candidatus Omnitrophota bacterium]